MFSNKNIYLDSLVSNEFEHNANILRYLINRIEKTDILEQKEIPPSSMNDEAVKESPKESVKKDLLIH